MKSLISYINESLARNIQGLESYTEEELNDIIKDYCIDKLEDVNDFDIVEIWLHGSRLRGSAKTNSDLDAVMFYTGKAKEDSLFNILNDEDPLYVDDIKVDVNPVCIISEIGINAYKKKSDAYDAEVLHRIHESYSDGTLDKTVKAPERNKVKKVIYDKLSKTGTTGKFWHDTAWEGVTVVTKDVQDALDKLNNSRTDGYQYEVSIAPDNGGYRVSDDGMSRWKQYKVELFKVHKDFCSDEEYPEPFMIGTLNCHAAGTIEDPFETYDMSFCIS